MTAFDKKQMDAMVNRFLGWKLPETFGPDCYVSFDKAKAQAKHGWPVGTNLLTADEARAMLEYVLDVTFIPDWSLLEATQSSLREHMRAIRLLMAAGHVTQEKVDQAFKLAANLKWPDGVPACQPPADKITIRYERAGRCFWHIGCTAQRHAPPMRIGQDDPEKRRTAIHCTACSEAGYYPHGSVGEVCCERVTAGAQGADRG
jgi:hypothetical protein